MIYVKLLVVVILLPALVFLWGSLFTKAKEFSPGELLLLGVLKMFTCFQIICVPLVIMRASFTLLFIIYSAVLLVGAAAAMVFHGREVMTLLIGACRQFVREMKLLQVLVLLLIAFQVGVAAYSTYIDDDDSFYVGAAVTTLETDTMYQYQAETGLVDEELPIRYILSPFAMFIAWISKVTGMEPAIMTHTLLFPLWVALSYVVYGLLGKLIFDSNRHNRNMFLFLVAVITMMGHYSIYSASTFILLRGHQGKAILAGIMIPLAIYFLMKYYGDRENCRWKTGLFFLLTAASTLISSMGIALIPVALAVGSMGYSFRSRSIKPAAQMLISCLPAVFLGFIYLCVTKGGIVL